MPDAPPSDWIDRYLRLLGARREPPSLPALRRLTRQHLLTVPFENVTTLLRAARYRGGAVPQPDPQALLTGWEQGRGGGLCYDASRTFGRLLRALGYSCFSITATITFPGSHEALIVHLGGEQYLVDVGNGAPLFNPVPWGAISELHHAGLSYRFQPGEATGTLVQERWIDGTWRLFCTYEADPRTENDMDAGLQAHHTPGQGAFTKLLILVRSTEESLYQLKDDELLTFTATGKTTRTLGAPADFIRVAAEVFGLPRLPILEARAAVEALRHPAERSARRNRPVADF